MAVDESLPPCTRQIWNFSQKPCIRHRLCYKANGLQYEKRQISRHDRLMLFRAAAGLSLAVWLFMAAAEVWTPLHAWLHGGTIPDNDDDCAIVAIAHGKIETVACDLPVPVPVTWIDVTPRVELSVFNRPVENLRSGRAPPVLPAVS
jgi:hypothetical protein